LYFNICFLFSISLYHLYLNSFPTRRSSDLIALQVKDFFPFFYVKLSLDHHQHESKRTDWVRHFHDILQDSKSNVRGTFTKVWKLDRKSTRLNSSHGSISYAVFCLKKKSKRI